MASSASTKDDDIITDINITPLVDIFLVLLIIFMITSNIVEQHEIPVNVPKAANVGQQAPEASGLAMDEQGTMYLDGVPMDSVDIVGELRLRVAEDSVHQVLIAAEQELPYREVVGLIDMIRGAGVVKYALKVRRG